MGSGTHKTQREGGPFDPDVPLGDPRHTSLQDYVHEIVARSGVPGISKGIGEISPSLTGVFPDALAVKMRGEEPNKYFSNRDDVGVETLWRETAVAQRAPFRC